uniref:ethanolamine-phosphate cytidylyltransferase n=1 Tax=Chromera velia CCMP2878 TaxID=1169474 RepID=A0A0G4H0P5_9ALVE|eukprot:Cvel_24185.t1-p1 / transcript=Cvel_24185.t1 / gene=Cvel_24185 / organism=Chromera_velia_CCMP2878 / gene_product=Ethanolamine-phosphate cytidylyltransferase, putative / transcript_product=Ethanolamine-phosphate cytidylyltransferase, putative / location=Cvel_scaffold2582:12192-13826(+) / protein_length=545 / sequence_SO=supercontig / SO=protein_coding / is_pseudo=false
MSSHANGSQVHSPSRTCDSPFSLSDTVAWGLSDEDRERLHDLLAAFVRIQEDAKLTAAISEQEKRGLLDQFLSEDCRDKAVADVELLRKYLNFLRGCSLEKPIAAGRVVSIYCDGVFDLTHSGHFNALRQAKALGDRLVVGINSDASAAAAKGMPIMNERERATMVRACKWVDDVIEATPYEVTMDLFRSTGCDYVCHGDDLALGEAGNDVYAEPRAAGLLKVFRRTEGISTTTIVSRLLLVAKDPLHWPPGMVEKPTAVAEWVAKTQANASASKQVLMNSKRLLQFMANVRQPKEGDKVVYIDGPFDPLHLGHLHAIQKAKALGDFLVVGIHDDKTVHRQRGRGFPILNLLERTLALLALRDVDEVVIGAPWKVDDFLLRSYRVDVVCSARECDEVGIFQQMGGGGSVPVSLVDESLSTSTAAFSSGRAEISSDREDAGGHSAPSSSFHVHGRGGEREASSSSGAGREGGEVEDGGDPFEVPRRLGIFHDVWGGSPPVMTTRSIIERIVMNRMGLLESLDARRAKEMLHFTEQIAGERHMAEEL